jgi:hypothetical protein
MRPRLFRLFGAFGSSALMGCATTDMLKDLSVGHTGCLQSEMVVTPPVEGASGFGYTWTVTCHGSRFLCSAMGKDVACHERQQTPVQTDAVPRQGEG